MCNNSVFSLTESVTYSSLFHRSVAWSYEKEQQTTLFQLRRQLNNSKLSLLHVTRHKRNIGHLGRWRTIIDDSFASVDIIKKNDIRESTIKWYICPSRAGISLGSVWVSVSDFGVSKWADW